MAGDVRGHDLLSWWENRAAYRQEASQAASRLRRLANRMTGLASGAKPSTVSGRADETVGSLIEEGQRIEASLDATRTQLQALDSQRQSIESAFASEKNAIVAECGERMHAEQDAARKKAYDSAVHAEKNKVVLSKLAAVLIMLAALFVMVRF